MNDYDVQLSPETAQMLNNMTNAEKDNLYRVLWFDYVKNDVKSFANESDYVLTDTDVEYIARQFVYEGRYDCNLSYWQNIENLILDK